MLALQVAAVVVLAVTWYRVAAHRWENDAYGYWIAWHGGLYDIALPAIRLGGLAVAVRAVPFLVGRSRLAFLIPSPLLRLWGVRPAATQSMPGRNDRLPV